MAVQFNTIQLYKKKGIAEKTPFSRLMCEALSLERPARLLDIGCGSGIIGVYALLNGSNFVYFNDIQKDAIKLTQRNLQRHRIAEASYQLLNSPFQQIDISKYQVDAIFFNPPQLPTDIVPIEHFSDNRERIFRDGGANGLNLIDQFVKWLIGCLPVKSKAYLGISSVLFVDDLLKDAEQRGLIVLKKCVKTVLLRKIFYPAVTGMPESERQRREISRQDDIWNKKIYILEFRRRV